MEMWMPSTGSSGRPLSEKCGSQNSDWQAGLRAIKRLNLGLFIDRKHDRVGGRRDIQADNISELLKEGRIVGELELPPAMRAETV